MSTPGSRSIPNWDAYLDAKAAAAEERLAVDRHAAKPPLVIYHSPCHDGFCAAWLIHSFYRADAEFFPAQYGQDPPDVVGRDVLMLDFTYPEPVLRQIAVRAASLLVLDHHASAKETLRIVAEDNPGMRYRFHNESSGARLTWNWLWEDNARSHSLPGTCPWLVDYTEDRDLWRWQLPYSKEINAVLRSYPLDFDLWDVLFNAGHPLQTEAMNEGAAILRAEEILIADHVSRAREIEMDGHRVLCVNATSHFSEIAGKLAEGRPFGVAWFERKDGQRQYSLRSREGGIDVSIIAQRHDGGGHKHAAGFEISPRQMTNGYGDWFDQWPNFDPQEDSSAR